MFFIEVIDGSDLHEGYIALSLDKAKEVTFNIVKEIYEEDFDDDDVCEWNSIMDCNSFEDLYNLVYNLACDTGTTFRFSEIKEGEDIELMS